uniref:Uncharacterized protein n=1 Tax=Anguilla anguilla TaxID=7936 RepID=A0A0E9RF78_ANGAN
MSNKDSYLFSFGSIFSLFK